MDKSRIDLAVLHAAQVVKITDDGNGPRRGQRQRDLDIIEDGAIAVRQGRIVAVGCTKDIVDQFDLTRAEVVEARGKVVIPGLVDSHTHPIFGGVRFEDYAQRLAGKSLTEVAAQGGGMGLTVAQTRAASDDELLESTLAAFNDMLKTGTTTAEAKSGYGLTVAQELRLLELIRKAADKTPMNIVPTFLGAHAVPREIGNADAYIDIVVNDMLPKVISQGIAKFCDATCENGWLTSEQSTRVLRRSAELGLPTRMHVDAFAASGGWRAANSVKAVCADHLTFTPDTEIEEIGSSETIAVLLPAAELYYLSERRANARKLIETGVPVALATDFCSSIRVFSLLQILPLAAAWFRMTPEEVIIAATLNGAYSVGMANSIGSLDPGKRADFVIVDVPNYRMLVFEMGVNRVDRVVVAGGKVVI